ncbi:uncharacterized protein LOC115205668 isoform X4 [Salmo trutta]|uniref:uncharacterized protein LOC115205668 isoform X4 n=1 Tax=Salmo trutta TaxID=8032 RepID=UPI0011301B1C|nr:uncharacterized protein LOC115205668 isoform X4 [Salmo trutta]
MDDDNHRLFHRVAEKLGWSEKGGLETAEQQLIKSISKTRRLAVGCHASRGAQDLPPPVQLHLLDSEEEDDRGSGKENQVSKGNNYRTKVFMESSDDDFDQFLVEQATPKTASRKHCSAAKKVSEPVLVLSSDSDDHFEKFLSRVKTPKPKLKEAERGSVDSLKNFVVDSFSSDDDFVAERKKKPTSKGAFKTPKPSSFQTPVRRPLSQCDTPVFLSDSEEDGIVMKSTWGTCHPVHQSPPSQTHKVKVLQSNQKDKIFFPSPSPLLPSLSPSSPPLCSSFTPSPTPLPRRNYSAPSKVEDSASSEEEFLSLLDRIKKNHKTGNTPTPKPNMGNTPTPNMGPNQKPPLSAPQPKASKEVGPRPLVRTPLDLKTPVRPLVTKPTGSQTEYTLKTSSLSSSSVSAAGCQTPGCVSLLSVSDSRLCFSPQRVSSRVSDTRLCFSPQRVRLQAVFLSACQQQGVRHQAVFLSSACQTPGCVSLLSVSAAGCQTPGCVSLSSACQQQGVRPQAVFLSPQRVSSRVSDTRLCFSPQRVRLQAVFLSSACQTPGCVSLLSVSAAGCQTPGCFLQSLSGPGSSYSRNFKQTKEELTSRLYHLYNTSVFNSKLPSNMSVSWNKKMRKTAGYCITGQERGGNRYARIQLSEKVCDSADRLRDTLVHEMCHAATWLINSVRDGHGPFWKLYARKATLAHPELPMVTRCHSYDINYKYQYQCSRCKNTLGRHSKSLDTQRFVCALCTGPLVLLTPAKPRAPTPFANFVKENYGSVRQNLVGQSHGEVMRKLSVDFATKTKLSQN